MKILKNKTYIALILFLLGPPAFRNYNLDFHASSGDSDIWFYIKIFSYFVIFFLIFEIKKFNELITYQKSFISIGYFIGIILFFLSSLVTDNNFSFFYTGFYTFGFVFYIFFKELFKTLDEENFIKIIKIVNLVFICLIVLTFFLSFNYPDIVGSRNFEKFNRISGNKFSDFKFIQMITFIISLYFFLNSNNFEKKQIIYLLISIIALISSYTRSIIFICFFMSLILIFFPTINRQNSIYKTKVFFIFIITSIFLILFSKFSLIEFVTRQGTVSIYDLSGRNLIWSYSFELMKDKFFGYGLGSGFKNIFTNLENIEFNNQILIVKNIGSAHNFFLEILVSGGWLPFFLVIIIHCHVLLTSFHNILKKKDNVLILLFSLFLCVNCYSLFEVHTLVPASNSFAFYWILLSLITAKNFQIKNEITRKKLNHI